MAVIRNLAKRQIELPPLSVTHKGAGTRASRGACVSVGLAAGQEIEVSDEYADRIAKHNAFKALPIGIIREKVSAAKSEPVSE